jgi:hypothetical protein
MITHLKGKYFNFFVLLFFSLHIISCDAPRNNPLDPLSSNYTGASIDGKVETFSIPHLGIPEVTLYWVPAKKYAKTDVEGNFLISEIEAEDGLLIIQKEGFKEDTLDIKWNGAKKITTQIDLNIKPVIDSVEISSMVINQTASTSSSFIDIRLKVIDKDNDVDTVYVRIQNKNINRIMDFNAAEKVYQTDFTKGDLNISDIEESVGLTFEFYVKDLFNSEFAVGSGNLTRVIKNGVSIISPTSNAVVDSLPELRWNSFSASYSFTFGVEVYTDDQANPVLVYDRKNINRDSTFLKVNSALPDGDYFWVVWVVDNFKNKVRSIPSFFTVQ